MPHDVYVDVELASILLATCTGINVRYDGSVAYNKDGFIDITEELGLLIEEFELEHGSFLHHSDSSYRGVPIELLQTLQFSDEIHLHKNGLIIITSEV